MFEKIENLHDLLEIKLQGLYDAEKQLTRAIPKMVDRATDSQLRMGLEKHLRETKTQVTRLEQVARNLNMDLNGAGCKAMEGMVEEASDLMSLRATDDVRDAAIISAAQGVEHYEIAQYGTVIQFASRLGYHIEANLLSESLQEEKMANETLNQVALSSVNEKAMSGTD